MIFHSQTDLINYWEGGKTYKQQEDNGERTIISDPSRTTPYLLEKYFQIRGLYKKYGSGSHEKIKKELGAITPTGDINLDARYKVVYKGGRTEESSGAFLFTFIDDCISLWEFPGGKEAPFVQKPEQAVITPAVTA